MNDPQNLWWATSGPATAAPSLAGEHRADVVVIGAGIMGCAAARALARAGAAVAILEAGTVGEGGILPRPGGFVVPAFSVGSPKEIIARLGHAGEEMCRVVGASAQRVFAIIGESEIGCDAQQGGWYHPAPSERAAEQLADIAAQWRSLGFEGELLGGAETRARTGAAGYEAAWFAPSGGTLHPLLYTRGLLAAAEAAGATLYENSAVVAIEKQARGYHVRSAGGVIAAERVLVCTNGDASLSPAIARSLVRVDVWQCATAPIAAGERAHLFADGACLSDMRQDSFTYRFDRDWRLITGALDMIGASPHSLAERMAKRLKDVLGLRATPPVAYLWSGTAAISAGRLPVTFVADDGVLSATACNGRGIALSTVVGEALAAHALGWPVGGLPHFEGGGRGSAAVQQRLARLYPRLAPLADWLAARGRITRS